MSDVLVQTAIAAGMDCQDKSTKKNTPWRWYPWIARHRQDSALNSEDAWSSFEIHDCQLTSRN